MIWIKQDMTFEDPAHRIVEIGAVELWNHIPTGETYHQYINPHRNMPQDAFNIHGISEQFLLDKPKFTTIADNFLDFIKDSKLIIHNATFDMKFLNAELTWAQKPILSEIQIIDTLQIARRLFPGSPVSLDALCRRFDIDNSKRQKHGALLDSEILADVYLELIGGKQTNFALSMKESSQKLKTDSNVWHPSPRPKVLKPFLTHAEIELHGAFIDDLGDKAVWKKFN